MKLEKKVAVVTGGSSGIGLAIAKRFVAEGAYDFITGRRKSELDKAVAEIGKNVYAVQGDIANLADLDNLYKIIKQEKGTLDIIIANAGMVEHQTIDQATPENFDKTFNTNARGTYFTVSKALPLMKDGGSIVLVSSGLHLKGLPAHGAYAATKAAIRSFSRTWAMELKDRKIRVNTLSPGAIDTPIFSLQFDTPEAIEAGKNLFASIAPLGRVGYADEIASAALFLASEDSSYSTGIDLIADGGITSV
jgi:NAD(P)-dependent dehydrogenase (short-subunit alcohol dehydrogenase family)